MTVPHGSYSRYADLACRCVECRTANREQQRSNSAIRRERPKDPSDPRHGSYNFYRNHGCRCDACKKSHSERCAIEYQNRKAKAEGRNL